MKDKIIELIKHAVGILPFMLTASDGTVKLNGARIMEGVIIAIVAGLLSGYVAVKELSVKMISVQAQVGDLNTRIDTLDSRLFNYITDKKVEDSKERRRGHKKE
jgi:hypothetical protein